MKRRNFLGFLPLSILAGCGGGSSFDDNYEENGKSRRIYREFTKANSVSIINESNFDIEFHLKINNNCFFGDTESVVSEIRGLAGHEARGFTFNSWRWLIDQGYHYDPYTAIESFHHDPALFLNSFVWGYCDDYAAVMANINTCAGIKSRICGLEGHVVSEHWIDGKWRVYDVDLRAVYLNRLGEVMGAEEISQNFSPKSLLLALRNPGAEDYFKIMKNDILFEYYDSQYGQIPWAYGKIIKDIYESHDNNMYYDVANVNSLMSKDLIVLPRGAKINLNKNTSTGLISMYGTEVPAYFLLELILKPNTEGRVALPLHPIEIQGGSIFLKSASDSSATRLTGDEATALLDERDRSFYDFYVATGSEFMCIKFLLNPIRFDLGDLKNIEVLTSATANINIQES